jgi:hypothetical protein
VVALVESIAAQAQLVQQTPVVAVVAEMLAAVALLLFNTRFSSVADLDARPNLY